MSNKDVVEVIKGLQQATANAYDGALDDSGKPIEIGLNREKSDSPTVSRLMDGFNVRVQAGKMVLDYHSEVLVKEVHDSKFESEIESTMEDVTKWLKKEYKKITGESITLKKKGKPTIRVENTSRIRTFVTAQLVYDIGGISSSKEEKRDVEKAIKDWLQLGKSKSEGFK